MLFQYPAILQKVMVETQSMIIFGFLQIAAGSLYELQTQIEISMNLKYLNKNEFDKQYESTREIERMLSSLTKKLKNRQNK